MAALEVFVSLVILAVLALGGLCWLVLIAALAAGRTVLPWTPRRQVPWGGVDLLLMTVSFLIAAGAALALLMPQFVRGGELTAAEAITLLWADAIPKLAFMAVGSVFIIFFRGATRADLGWTIGPSARYIPLGFATFMLLAPIVFAIQAALVHFGGWESEHPLIELVKKLRSVPIFATAFFATVVVAPLTEEWYFRVLLQGWLEKMFSGRATPEEILGLPQSQPIVATVVDEPHLISPAEISNPYQTPIASPQPAATIDVGAPISPFRAWPPIFLSSLLFALAHLGHGPDFIPLFIFAVGLGFVYQRTHSIVPSLIVHACLNLTSMVILGLQVFK